MAFLEGIVVLERSSNGFVRIVLSDPSDFCLVAQLEVVSLCSFPFFSSESKSDKIFTFTTDSYYCYGYNVLISGSFYSIVLFANYLMPNLYKMLLKNIDMFFVKQCIGFDIKYLVSIIKTLVIQWTVDPNNDMCAYMFDSTYKVKAPKCLLFDEYDPLSYFSCTTEFINVWKCLMTKKTVLVMCDSPEILEDSIYSLLSLVTPFVFKDPILLTYNKYDPRLYDNSKSYSIIGVVSSTDISIPHSVHIVLHASKTSIKLSSQELIITKKKASLLYEIICHISDRNLETDPYHELLGFPIIGEDINDIMSSEMKRKTLNYQELKTFESTKTFQGWSISRRFRSIVRDAFLSSSAKELMVKKTTDELKAILKYIPFIIKAYPNDNHLKSVFKNHRRIILEITGSNSDASDDSE